MLLLSRTQTNPEKNRLHLNEGPQLENLAEYIQVTRQKIAEPHVVEDVADVVEDGEDGVHAGAVVLDHRRPDEVGIERIPERVEAVQRKVGQHVDAIAAKRGFKF